MKMKIKIKNKILNNLVNAKKLKINFFDVTFFVYFRKLRVKIMKFFLTFNNFQLTLMD